MFCSLKSKQWKLHSKLIWTNRKMQLKVNYKICFGLIPVSVLNIKTQILEVHRVTEDGFVLTCQGVDSFSAVLLPPCEITSHRLGKKCAKQKINSTYGKYCFKTSLSYIASRDFLHESCRFPSGHRRNMLPYHLQRWTAPKVWLWT